MTQPHMLRSTDPVAVARMPPHPRDPNCMETPLHWVHARWNEQPPPTRDEITRAFWHACRAAKQNTAAFLHEHGADPKWVGWDHKTPRQVANESGNAEFIAWCNSL